MASTGVSLACGGFWSLTDLGDLQPPTLLAGRGGYVYIEGL
jgi:hypothetical protein